MYKQQGSGLKFIQQWIREKSLERNHVAHEASLLAMVLDRSIAANPEYVVTEACEMVCSRLYALIRAFAHCRTCVWVLAHAITESFTLEPVPRAMFTTALMSCRPPYVHTQHQQQQQGKADSPRGRQRGHFE